MKTLVYLGFISIFVCVNAVNLVIMKAIDIKLNVHIAIYD